MTQSAPLTGVRILAVEQFGAGPLATMYLADMGAEVIKIEDPSVGGDVGRYVPPTEHHGESLYFETFNRGKKSIALDLKNSAGRGAFLRLATSADVIFNNLRGDQAASLGLTYEALRALKPSIVCVSLSGYGHTGSRVRDAGYDALVQAEAGWASLTGEPEGPPTKSGLSLADYVAGLSAALGTMIALYEVKLTGRGRDVDVNLYDAALSMLTYPATWYLSRRLSVKREPLSAHPSIVPFQFFRTIDGYIAVACAKQKFFAVLSTQLGLEHLVRDPRFADFESRRVNRDALLEILGTVFRTKSTREWIAQLRALIPIAPVRTMEEALGDAENSGSSMVVTYDHPNLGEVRTVGGPFVLGGYKPTYSRAPELGGDSIELLKSVAYSDDDIELLRRDGAFGGNASDV